MLVVEGAGVAACVAPTTASALGHRHTRTNRTNARGDARGEGGSDEEDALRELHDDEIVWCCSVVVFGMSLFGLSGSCCCWSVEVVCEILRKRKR